MSLREQLAELGWWLSAEGVEQLSDGGQVQDVKLLAKKALDYDLRDIGAAAFPEDFPREPSRLEAPVVVQIQKIRNVSAPKANEESTHAPRMLKLTLHDGKTSCAGVEISPLPSISINTPPGTKVLLQSEGLQAQHGLLWLEPGVVSVLGGQVTHMIEKWELNRSLAKHTRGGVGADGGPPPWIPFGQRLEEQAQDKSFKSLQEANKQDNAEFEAQRKGAIAEAQRLAGAKKVFGGGTKPLLDANVQRIVDAGFSEEQAENALKFSKNNVDRALRSLQRRDGSENAKKEKPQKEAEPTKRKGRNKEGNDDEAAAVKPSGKVSLFDFLEDKLPNVPDKEKPRTVPNNTARDDRNFTRDRNNQRNSRPQGNRYEPSNKYRSDSSNNTRNHPHDGQPREGAREERKYQPHPHERPPRFQRKMEENSRRNQSQSNYESYGGSYSGQPPTHYGARTEPRQQAPYVSSTMDVLTDAAAELSMSGPPPGAHRSTDDPAYRPQPQHLFTPSQNLQGSVGADGMSYRRMPKYQEPYRREQLNGFLEPPPPPPPAPVYSNLGYGGQQAGYHNGRQGYGYGQRAESGARTTPAAYLASSMVAFQNPAVSEQARSVLGGGELQWNIGDRCLAHYWEDNNFYEAEITGVSASTVVVKFCTYGNHEEILKSNCLPYPTQGGSGYRGPAPAAVAAAGYSAARP